MFDFLKSMFGSGETVDIKALLDNGAMIVDVRTPDEFRSGHIKNAVNIPLGTIANNVNRLQAAGKPIVAYCRSGMRSGQAVGEMKSYGLEAYNGGGIGEMQAHF